MVNKNRNKEENISLKLQEFDGSIVEKGIAREMLIKCREMPKSMQRNFCQKQKTMAHQFE